MTRKNRNILYNVAAAGGGVAAGIVISRLLPPVFAQMSGSMRSRFGRDPFERLIKDHQKIRYLVNEMNQIPEGHLGRRTKLYLNLKRTLAKHAMAEEDVVYPLLHGPAHEPQQSKHLYDDHAELKIHLYELEQLLMQNANWSDRVRSLRDMLEKHLREEEEIHFPKLRQFLDKRRTRQVSGEIRREEALVL
jgi:iron-sulfur cluster repair protein YtfE (RIC family)